MDQFLERNKLPKHIHEKIPKLNNLVSTKKKPEFVLKNLSS